MYNIYSFGRLLLRQKRISGGHPGDEVQCNTADSRFCTSSDGDPGVERMNKFRPPVFFCLY